MTAHLGLTVVVSRLAKTPLSLALKNCDVRQLYLCTLVVIAVNDAIGPEGVKLLAREDWPNLDVLILRTLFV